MHSWALAAAGSAAVVLVSSPIAVGDIIELPAAKDNTLYSSSTGSRSNGRGDYFFAGVTAQGGIRRGLVAFDLASLPAGAVVNSATLTLHMSRTISTSEAVGAHRVLADWGEGNSNANNMEGTGAPAQAGDATWLHTFWNTSFWASTGGDYAPLPSATASVADVGFYSWSSPQLAGDVQSWIDAPATNFGWELLCNEVIQATAKRFDTRENPILENRPRLVVDYTIVPEPAGGTAAIVFVSMLLARRGRAVTSALS